MGPNKFYGNISFIRRQAALFGNKGLWGGGGGGRVSQYRPAALLFPPLCVFNIHPALMRCTARGHNGSHNGSQCSMFIGHTHTTWATMGLTMVRGKRRVRGGRMVLDKCFVSTCPASSTAADIFLSDTAWLLMDCCSCCRKTRWEEMQQRDVLKEG